MYHVFRWLKKKIIQKKKKAHHCTDFEADLGQEIRDFYFGLT